MASAGWVGGRMRKIKMERRHVGFAGLMWMTRPSLTRLSPELTVTGPDTVVQVVDLADR